MYSSVDYIYLIVYYIPSTYLSYNSKFVPFDHLHLLLPPSVPWNTVFFQIVKVKCFLHAMGINGNPLQYSCLENPMDGGAWWAAVHGVAEGRTRLSDFTFTFHFHVLEKEMGSHSSVLAWRIPGTGEPGGLLSMGSHRVGHN